MANIASAEKISRRKKEILEASISVFASKGYHSACIADIANRLGVGHGTLYRYYKNKRDLFNAVLAEILGKLAVVVREEPPVTNSLQAYSEQLKRIAAAMAAIFQGDPRLARIVFYESMGVDRDVIRQVQNTLDLFALAVEQYIENGVKKGFLRANIDQQVASKIITAMFMNTVKVSVIAADPDTEIRRWSDEIIRIMIGGLQA